MNEKEMSGVGRIEGGRIMEERKEMEGKRVIEVRNKLGDEVRRRKKNNKEEKKDNKGK